MAYRVINETRGSRQVITLKDDATGASASVLPSFGFNLFDLRLAIGGKIRPILATVPDFVEKPRDPARNGTPILFPYPNRVRDGKYSFGGKNYQLPVTLGPNAIHGFAMDAAWDVVDSGAGENEAFVEGRYQLAKHSPGLRPLWPTDAILQVRFTLSGRKLTMKITVTNPTDRDLPYGFGIHPYFKLPLDSGADASKTSVIYPASKYWVLEEFLPTGEVKPVTDALDFRNGKPRLGLKLDDVFTGLTFEGDRAVCRLRDQNIGGEIRILFDKNFRELVVYTPKEDDVISLEPYTQTTDAINLQAKGVDAGLRVLKHGQSESMVIEMETL